MSYLARKFEEIGDILGVPAGALARLSFTPNQRYSVFLMPKRSGGFRPIHRPSHEMAIVQRLIKRRVLDRIPITSGCVTGFRPGVSIVDNARFHAAKAIVVKFDLKDFFPSISFGRVLCIFQEAGFDHEVARALAFLTTVRDGDPAREQGSGWKRVTRRWLPQGAPTSPGLANLAAARMDARLEGLAKSLGFIYTRYADDMTFSTGDPKGKVDALRDLVAAVVHECGFRLNGQKSAVMRAPGGRRVTGLIVDADEPRVPRDQLRRVRAMIHRFRTDPQHAEAKRLLGCLSYMRMVNPKQVEKAVRDWPDVELHLRKAAGI